MYAEWLGEDPDDFFYSRRQRALFRTVISRVLLRVNTLSGVAYANDPAVLSAHFEQLAREVFVFRVLGAEITSGRITAVLGIFAVIGLSTVVPTLLAEQ